MSPRIWKCLDFEARGGGPRIGKNGQSCRRDQGSSWTVVPGDWLIPQLQLLHSVKWHGKTIMYG
jgi:hypothetical protein